MILLDIVWPAIAMAALIFTVTFVLFGTRFKHMAANPPKAEDFADGSSAMRYFAPVEMPANNLRNLFEIPILFFALVPLLITTGLDTDVQGAFGWVYVLLRAVHSYFHIGKNVKRRFQVFLLSTIVLMAMWIGFAVDVVSVAATMEAY